MILERVTARNSLAPRRLVVAPTALCIAQRNRDHLLTVYHHTVCSQHCGSLIQSNTYVSTLLMQGYQSKRPARDILFYFKNAIRKEIPSRVAGQY